jgi:hypothetical protein
MAALTYALESLFGHLFDEMMGLHSPPMVTLRNGTFG